MPPRPHAAGHPEGMTAARRALPLRFTTALGARTWPTPLNISSSPPRDYGIAAGRVKDAIIARRGTQARNIAKVAAARKLLTCVFYAMRDGQARCLAARAAARQAA